MKRVLFGATVSLSGAYAHMGRESYEGLSLWVSDVNAGGGLVLSSEGTKGGKGGEPLRVELIHYDDESDGSAAGRLYERLITRDEVDVLIGPYSSGLTIEALSVSRRHRRTLWNYGGASDGIAGGGGGSGFLVSAITPSSRYLLGAVSLVRDMDPGASRLTVVYARDSGFSRNAAEGAAVFGAESGFEVSEFTYLSGSGEFDEILKEAASRKPDLLLGIGRLEDDIAFAREIARSGTDAKAVGVVAAGIDLFGKELGGAAEGFLAPSHWERGRDITPDFGPSSEEFVSSFLKAYGKPPGFLAAQAYNIGVLIERSALAARSLKDDDLRRAALGLKCRTFYGDFSVDPKTGMQRGHEMPTIQWQRGGRVIVYPRRLRQAPPIYPLRGRM